MFTIFLAGVFPIFILQDHVTLATPFNFQEINHGGGDTAWYYNDQITLINIQ